MKRFYLFALLMFTILTAVSNIVFAQSNTADTLSASKPVIAGRNIKLHLLKNFYGEVITEMYGQLLLRLKFYS